LEAFHFGQFINWWGRAGIKGILSFTTQMMAVKGCQSRQLMKQSIPAQQKDNVMSLFVSSFLCFSLLLYGGPAQKTQSI